MSFVFLTCLLHCSAESVRRVLCNATPLTFHAESCLVRLLHWSALAVQRSAAAV